MSFQYFFDYSDRAYYATIECCEEGRPVSLIGFRDGKLIKYW